MRVGSFILIAFFIGISSVFSQEKATTVSDDGLKLFYRTEMYGGLLIHTNGYGINFRKGFRKTGFSKRLLSIEVVNMKHPKQYKSYNPYYDDTKGFFFGKMNSLSIIRPAIGHQKVLYGKEVKRGVQISYLYFAGASIGLVKPVYLEIAYPTVPTYKTLSTEKYDSEEHTIDQIFGRAPATKGIEETKIYPGFHGKVALNFEYAPADDMLRAIETGVSLDAFHKKVPIMAFSRNSQFFLTLYINVQFGKKYL